MEYIITLAVKRNTRYSLIKLAIILEIAANVFHNISKKQQSYALFSSV